MATVIRVLQGSSVLLPGGSICGLNSLMKESYGIPSLLRSRDSRWFHPTARVFPSGLSPRRSKSWRAKVGGDDSASSTEVITSIPEALPSTKPSKLGEAKGFAGPQKSAVSEKKKSSKSSSSVKRIRRDPPSKPLIGVRGGNEQTQQIETAIVASLVFMFFLIISEGITLAASGLLPEEWDQFAVNLVYPAFTPSVGVFLAIAAGYGVWKYFGGGTGTSGT